MTVSYKRLWKTLIDQNMSKSDLRLAAGITTNALAKLGRNEHVSTAVLSKVCQVLECRIEDIVEFVADPLPTEQDKTPMTSSPVPIKKQSTNHESRK